MAARSITQSRYKGLGAVESASTAVALIEFGPEYPSRPVHIQQMGGMHESA